MNKRRFHRKLLLIAAVLAFALLSAGTVAAGDAQAPAAQSTPTAHVDTYALNVRAGPGVAYRAVAVTALGQQVALLGRNDAATWAKIRLASGVEGWVNASYLVSTVSIASLPVAGAGAPTPTGVVNTGAVHVRSGPGVAYASRAIAYEGTSVTLLARDSAATWVKARLPGGLEGWIGAHLLNANVAISGLPVVDAGPPPAAATGWVNTYALNVRSGPGVDYSVLVAIPWGTNVSLLGRAAHTNWVKVRLASGQEGWVNASFLDASVSIANLPVIS